MYEILYHASCKPEPVLTESVVVYGSLIDLEFNVITFSNNFITGCQTFYLKPRESFNSLFNRIVTHILDVYGAFDREVDGKFVLINKTDW